MKRTLFNTMMGCLAALSLAGCGGSGSGSGGGSSTMPSESLISEGYSSVHLHSYDSGKLEYYCILGSDRSCLFSPHFPKNFNFKGRWTEEFLGDGKFQITFRDFSKADDSLNLDCKIDFTLEPITLTIDEMSKYRAGQLVTASFDKAPFTHTAGTECNKSATAGTGLELQMH